MKPTLIRSNVISFCLALMAALMIAVGSGALDTACAGLKIKPGAKKEAPVEDLAEATEEEASEKAIEAVEPTQDVAEQEAIAEGDDTDEDEAIDEEEMMLSTSTFDEKGGEAGVLLIESKPEGARVFVDGEEKGLTPVDIKDLSEGSHEIIIYASGKGAYRQTIQTGSGRVFVDLNEDGGFGIGILQVTTDPPNATVSIDGKRLGITPFELPVKAGGHAALIAKDGYKEERFTLSVEAEKVNEVRTTLEPKEGAILVITSPAGAEVILDDKSMGQAWEPLRIQDVQPGTHRIEVVKKGFRSWVKEDVVVKKESTTTVMAPMLPENNNTWVRVYTEPAGATVWIDGMQLGDAGADGLAFKTTKGAHTLRLALNPAVTPGYRPLEISVNFTEDQVSYEKSPVNLPKIDENFTHAMALYERGELEKAISLLDRVSKDHPNYAEARVVVSQILAKLGRVEEIPPELETLLEKKEYGNNPVINLAMAYWSIEAASGVNDTKARPLLERGLASLEKAVQGIDFFPPEKVEALALKAYYYTGIIAESLFDISGDKAYVKKGSQAWELFFARLQMNRKALDDSWIDKARQHHRKLKFLEKKLGG